MAATGATAAAPAPPAEGKVIPIHSLDEWSMQIDEANSTDTKKLVFIDFFLMRLFFSLLRGSHLLGRWLGAMAFWQRFCLLKKQFI
jgi:hypothetical protein